MMLKDWTLNGSQLTLTLNSAEVWKIGPSSRLKRAPRVRFMQYVVWTAHCTLQNAAHLAIISIELIAQIMKQHLKKHSAAEGNIFKANV